MLRTALINMLIWAAYAYDIFTLAMDCVQYLIGRYQDVKRRFADRTGNYIPAV
jgi:hypothetical protein